MQSDIDATNRDMSEQIRVIRLAEIKQIDSDIRSSLIALPEGTPYSISPDEHLSARGVTGIVIERQDATHVINISFANGFSQAITLSPNELSGLDATMGEPVGDLPPEVDGYFLTKLARLALRKTKGWISDQYNDDQDGSPSTKSGRKVTRRCPHLILLPLGRRCKQNGNPTVEEKMQSAFMTTPYELNHALVAAQIGRNNLLPVAGQEAPIIDPRIAGMVENLLLRIEQRVIRQGYGLSWVDISASEMQPHSNGPRMLVTGLHSVYGGKPYNPNQHFFEVSFDPGVSSAQGNEPVTIMLSFPELGPPPAQSGTIYERQTPSPPPHLP